MGILDTWDGLTSEDNMIILLDDEGGFTLAEGELRICDVGSLEPLMVRIAVSIEGRVAVGSG